MERRAAIYCSRPPFPMTQDIMSGGSRIVLMPYNDNWRRLRKIMHQILASRQQEVYKPYQDLESKHLCWDYLHNPDRWFAANGRFANSVIMSVVFGTRSDLDNPDVVELFETLELFLENQQPGANIVDAFPVLANLPEILQWWRPKGQRIFEKTTQLVLSLPTALAHMLHLNTLWLTYSTNSVYRRALDKVIRDTANGTQKDCFAMEFMKISAKENFTETQNLFVLGTLMEAGSDTSRVSIGQIIAGAATYPDWVARARAQLDAVCGVNAERLPGWEDRDKLPYISAVVKEGFRWRPNIAEIGAPTSLIQDDEYEGYKFPKGTVFTWNAWAIALSDNEYPQAERFWPDRFLNEDLDNPLKGHWAFGPGM
jgi:cytochrome P450